MDCSRRTIQRALDALSSDRWIEVRQIGETGAINAYILNDRIVWHGARDNLRYSLFSASVVISSDDQPYKELLGVQESLRRLPHIGEVQIAAGDGFPRLLNRFHPIWNQNRPRHQMKTKLHND